MVETRSFTIYTDHKPITFAFVKKNNQCSLRQFHHLDFISQFTTDIRHVAGEDNMVADALSRIEGLAPTLDFEALAAAQVNDKELQQYLDGEVESALQLKLVRIPRTESSVFCDISTGTARPFITEEFREAAFKTVHRLSHPGVKTTVKLVTQRYIWPSIKVDCRLWARNCLQCQRSKVSRHVSAPIGSFAPPSARFKHVHIDMIVMPSSEAHRYCLTMVDRFTRWPEAVPMPDQEASTVARIFYDNWISQFGTPLRITTDQGRQFESHLFKHRNRLLGTTHLRTIAYHPAANGMVERFHRQLKAAIMCHDDERWTQYCWVSAQPGKKILKGLRQTNCMVSLCACRENSSVRSTTQTTQTMTTHSSKSFESTCRACDQVVQLATERAKFSSSKTMPPQSRSSFAMMARNTCYSIPCDGPYKVVQRNDRTFVVEVNGRNVTISIDRLKPAYTMSDDPGHEDSNKDTGYSGTNRKEPAMDPPPTHRTEAPRAQVATRAGRHVRFPDRLQ